MNSSYETKKQVIQPKSVWHPDRGGFKHPQPFSQGVIAPRGRMVWVAGQVALNLKGEVIGKGDAGEQTRAALENMKAVLAEAGASLHDVVKLTVFLTNMADLPKVQEVRSCYFPADPPSSSTIAVSQLVNADLLVEIEGIAVLPEERLEKSEGATLNGTVHKIDISQETYETLDALRREGETLSELLERMGLVLRASGLFSGDPALRKGPIDKKASS